MDEHRDHPAVPGAAAERAWWAHRRRALDVAYRLLGSLSEAEDVVQEAYLRLVRTGPEGIDDPAGWLVTVTSRLCLDQLRSAQRRRAAYVGPWLPEPVVERAGGGGDPADRVTLDDSVRLALLVVLEELTPPERTAFVLHDVFGIPFPVVAGIVGRSPAACRQLASRARRRVRADPGRPAPDIDPAEQRRVVERFAAACATGRVEALVEVLDPDAVGEFDSGGLVPAAPTQPVVGAARIARILVRSFAGTDATFDVARVNGEPGLVIETGGRVVAVAVVATTGGRVRHIHAVGNPEKLAHLNRV